MQAHEVSGGHQLPSPELFIEACAGFSVHQDLHDYRHFANITVFFHIYRQDFSFEVYFTYNKVHKY